MKKIIIILGVMLWSCGGHEERSYEEITESGWYAFQHENLDEAVRQFQEAKELDPDQSAAYTGLGWCYLLQNDPQKAELEFNKGWSQTGVTPDLYAGWAFALNALRQYYPSNANAEAVLNEFPVWTFEKKPAITYRHLRLLKAENYFALGDFSSSLAEVQSILTFFWVDVHTTEGRAALAQRIELLNDYINTF